MGPGPNGSDGQVMSIAPERVSPSEQVSRVAVSDLRTSERYLRAAVTDLIERNFRDPDFSVEVVARHLHVSRRHLYRVLAGSPTSLAEMIADRRLEWARRLLAGPGESETRSGGTCFGLRLHGDDAEPLPCEIRGHPPGRVPSRRHGARRRSQLIHVASTLVLAPMVCAPHAGRASAIPDCPNCRHSGTVRSSAWYDYIARPSWCGPVEGVRHEELSMSIVGSGTPAARWSRSSSPGAWSCPVAPPAGRQPSRIPNSDRSMSPR